ILIKRVALAGRTFESDLGAVELTRNPAALVSALRTLREHPADVARVAAAGADLWCTYPRPIHGTGDDQMSRPTLAERIRAIEVACGLEHPATARDL
ncbi:MAG TPA: hypothetical protein VFR41_15245, partial [Acidimicrobiia bacterium]|nr:hypothetical protein [Acidimicrobiia bacterium]